MGSIGFTIAATIFILGAQALWVNLLHWGEVVDLNKLIGANGDYLQRNAATLAVVAVGELLVACTFAFVCDIVLARMGGEEASVTQDTAWFQVFREDRPKGCSCWVHVKLEDETSFFGLLRSYSTSGDPKDREIVLEGAQLTLVKKPVVGTVDGEGEVIGDRWERVIVPASQIRFIRVQYRDTATGQRVQSRRLREAVESHAKLANLEPVVSSE